MFNCPNFGFRLKEWGFGIWSLTLESIIGSMNIAHQPSNVMVSCLILREYFIYVVVNISKDDINSMFVLCCIEV